MTTPNDGGPACSFCNDSQRVWACDTCATIYAEYVNGCPRCWSRGVRSGGSWQECPYCRGRSSTLLAELSERGGSSGERDAKPAKRQEQE